MLKVSSISLNRLAPSLTRLLKGIHATRATTKTDVAGGTDKERSALTRAIEVSVRKHAGMMTKGIKFKQGLSRQCHEHPAAAR